MWSMMKKNSLMQFFFLAVLFFYISEALGSEVSGYFKTFAIHNDGNLFRGSQTSWENVLRLRLVEQFHENVRGELVYSFHPSVRKAVSENSLLYSSPFSYRIEDFDNSLGKLGRDVPIFHNLDRLNLSLSLPFADLQLGRQAISFGKARVLNPCDIISPFSFDTLDQEERLGVDAIRAIIPLGDLSDIDMGYIAGRHFSMLQSAAFVNGNFHFWGSDFMATAMYFRKNMLLGLGLQRAFWEAGMWAECAYTFTNSFEAGIKDNHYFRSSIGADYNFTENVYAFAEYHYNQIGVSSSKSLSEHISQVGYTQGSVYLLRRHYFVPGFIWQITPLMSIRGEIFCNIDTPSGFSTLNVGYSFFENSYFDVGFSQVFGEPTSEFKQYFNRYFLSLRHYF